MRTFLDPSNGQHTEYVIRGVHYYAPNRSRTVRVNAHPTGRHPHPGAMMKMANPLDGPPTRVLLD